MSRASNLSAVIRALTIADQQLPAASRAWQIISRVTWELPTTILGLLTSITVVLLYNGSILHHHGATFIRLPHAPEPHRYWAFTLGTYIIGSRHSAAILPHEYGHYLQSRTLGPLYLPVIALPSLLSAALDPKDHRNRWFEKDADRRSASYFA